MSMWINAEILIKATHTVKSEHWQKKILSLFQTSARKKNLFTTWMIATCCVAKVSNVSRCLTVSGQISGVERFEWISPFSGLHLLQLSTSTLICLALSVTDALHSFLLHSKTNWESPITPPLSKFIQLEKGTGKTENEKPKENSSTCTHFSQRFSENNLLKQTHR